MNNTVYNQLVLSSSSIFYKFKEIFESEDGVKLHKAFDEAEKQDAKNHILQSDRSRFLSLYNAICRTSFPNKNMSISPKEIVYINSDCGSPSMPYSLVVNFVVITKECADRIGSIEDTFKFCPAISSPIGEMYILVPDCFTLDNTNLNTEEGKYNFNCFISMINRLALLSTSYITRVYETLKIFPSIRSDFIALSIVVPCILEVADLAQVDLTASDIFALLPAFPNDDMANHKIGIIDHIKYIYNAAFSGGKTGILGLVTRLLDGDLIHFIPTNPAEGTTESKEKVQVTEEAAPKVTEQAESDIAKTN